MYFLSERKALVMVVVVVVVVAVVVVVVVVVVARNQEIHTSREFMKKRSDVINKNVKMKICLPIDVRIPADRNIMQKGS
jgi:hypothetical protein